MKLSFDIGIEDVTAFNSCYYDADPAVRKRFLITRLTIAVLLVLTGLVGYFKGGWMWLVYFGILAFLYVSFIPRFDKWMWLKLVRSQATKPDNAVWLGKREMDFDEENVRVSFDKGEEKVLWSIFIKRAETDSHFFLFQTPRQALIIPKRAMTKTQIDELTQLLNNKIKK